MSEEMKWDARIKSGHDNKNTPSFAGLTRESHFFGARHD
jgi:hypothetical protein